MNDAKRKVVGVYNDYSAKRVETWGGMSAIAVEENYAADIVCTVQTRDYLYTFPNGAQIISYSQGRQYDCRQRYGNGYSVAYPAANAPNWH